MADTLISANMNLPVPVVGVDPGPDWAQNINNCLTLIDQHDHSPGYGVQITPAGMNINTDLSFGSNSAIDLASAVFIIQAATLSSLNSMYDVGGELYFNDGAGNKVQMTLNGSVNAAAGSITGLVSPASAAYVSGSQTFVWQANAGVPASMDFGSAIFRDLSTPYRGITLGVTTPLAAAYNLYLPTALPSQQSFMTLNAAGQMSAPWTVDNTTIKITANQLVAQPSALQYAQEEHSWELNGPYPDSFTFPITFVDSIFFAPYNITIQSVWIYNGTAGASGTTEFDLKTATPGGSFTTILSTTGKITSAAASNIWTDTAGVVGVQTGVTKPVLSVTSIAAGSAIRWDVLQSMAAPAIDARIRIFYKRA